MSFSFRFQRILNIRETLEKQEMIRFSLALLERNDAAEAVDNWKSLQAITVDNVRRLYATNPLHVAEVQSERAHLEWVREELAMAHAVLDEAEAALQEALATLQKATREKKSMERLRERHAADYAREEARREQAVMDEIGSRGDLYAASGAKPTRTVSVSTTPPTKGRPDRIDILAGGATT